MSSSEASSEVTPKRRIIANQTAELVTLQQKLARFEGIGKRYEEHKILLDEAIKAKHALQEIFFNTTMEKRELESINNALNDIINEKDNMLREYKQDNFLEVDSIKNLHSLELSSIHKKYNKKYNKLSQQNECFMDAIKAKHRFKSDLSSIKYDALSTKYKCMLVQNKQLIKQLQLFKSQILLMSKDTDITSQYESIIISLLNYNNNLSKNCKNELNTKQELLCKLISENNKMRSMYQNIKQIVIDLDDKIVEITLKNNKLNTIIEQNDIATSKMQRHFQKDIANKARVIEKLEIKIEQIINNNNNNENANDLLKDQNEIFETQINVLRNEKLTLQTEIKHLNDKLLNKNDYVNALKKQIEDNNKNINKLNRENANMESLNKNGEKLLDENNNNFKKLSEKYKVLQGKSQKLANKLKQTYSDKKQIKKEYNELKKELRKLKEENVRIDAEIDKRNDSFQVAIDKYKEKILKRNQQINELQDVLNIRETETNSYKQQIALLQKENEQQKFLIEHLEIDNNEHDKVAQKRRDIRNTNRNVYDQIVNETTSSQNQCDQVLQEIEDYDDNDDNDEDDDLNVHNVHHNVNRLSGNKRRRSIDINETDDNGNSINEDMEYEPPRKKARRSANNNHKNQKNNKKDNKQDQEISATPFKANKSIFKARKQRNKTNINLPKPRLI